MKIHEYQAKDILERYGVAVPKGEVANTLEEALDVAKRLFTGGAKGVVVKAQIHAGGRGKGGGVKLAKTLQEAEEYTKKILGMQLVTHQTGPHGQKVQRTVAMAPTGLPVVGIPERTALLRAPACDWSYEGERPPVVFVDGELTEGLTALK